MLVAKTLMRGINLFRSSNRSTDTKNNATVLSHAPEIMISDLSAHYGEKTALSKVSLHVKAGEITALIGPSGCGKSTLLSVINRLSDLHHCSASGEVLVDGTNILDDKTDLHSLRSQIGMVFQKPNPFPMSIADNLRFPLKEHGIKNKEELNTKIQNALTEVGLWEEVKDRLDDSALGLSGGQQQRLCFARALCLEPKVLLLDEPCSALDPHATQVVENLISNLRHKYTVLMVTHNLAQAKRIADNVAVCWVDKGCGCIVESGGTAEVFEFPKQAITEAYLNGTKG